MEVGAGIQVSPNMLRLFDRQSARVQMQYLANFLQDGVCPT